MNSWEVQADTVHERENLAMIEHCFSQLSEDDVWWRPYEGHNALGNIVLHLCGNLEQWIIHGIPGRPDTRNRPAEFAHREPIPKTELMDRLRQTIEAVDRVYAAQTPESLLEVRRIQGFDVRVQGAIHESVTHLSGHTQEIVWITRLRLGPAYRFLWTPATPEQGA
jgi:hypothetical protein